MFYRIKKTNLPGTIDLVYITFSLLYHYYPGWYHSCLLYNTSTSRHSNYL